MPILANGDVVPSFLETESSAGFWQGGAIDNNEMRVGEVMAIIYPDDKESVTGKVVEYRVKAQIRVNNTAQTRIYESCTLINPLAGLADKFMYTLRPDPSIKNQASGIGKGSKVLLQFLNGESNSPVIIGGIRDPNDTKAVDVKDLGHHLAFNFNGVSVDINKDGEFKLVYNGKTKIDGSTDVSGS